MLSSLKSAGKNRKRIGRGITRGGTSGKGHKGQKARSGGKVPIQFEGGQMPLTRRLPKRGFTNARFKVTYDLLSLDMLNNLFDNEQTITKKDLLEKNIIKKNSKNPIKVLANGLIEKKLIIYADAFSDSARKLIEKAGGKAYKSNQDKEQG